AGPAARASGATRTLVASTAVGTATTTTASATTTTATPTLAAAAGPCPGRGTTTWICRPSCGGAGCASPAIQGEPTNGRRRARPGRPCGGGPADPRLHRRRGEHGVRHPRLPEPGRHLGPLPGRVLR